MLDKIIVLSCRKQAIMSFTDKPPFSISSDTDVVPVLLWFINDPRAHLLVDGETVMGIEVRQCDDEVTRWTAA